MLDARTTLSPDWRRAGVFSGLYKLKWLRSDRTRKTVRGVRRAQDSVALLVSGGRVQRAIRAVKKVNPHVVVESTYRTCRNTQEQDYVRFLTFYTSTRYLENSSLPRVLSWRLPVRNSNCGIGRSLHGFPPVFTSSDYSLQAFCIVPAQVL